MAVHNSVLRLLSYNCRGYNASKRSYMATLLSKCDFLFCQEHWLSGGQLDRLDEVSESHYSVAVSGFGSAEILHGRPYGGCALFWPRQFGGNVQVIDTNSNRLCALHVVGEKVNLLLICVYMPCESSEIAFDEFCTVLTQIADIVDSCEGANTIIGGDFNVDFSRNTDHLKFLSNFCDLHGLCPCIHHSSSSVDYTYNFGMERFSAIDHFIISSSYYCHVLSYNVLHETDNCSDHDPLCLTLDAEWSSVPDIGSCRTFHSKLSWHKANSDHISNYKQALQTNLSSIKLPLPALSCKDVLCCHTEHAQMLNQYTSDIIQSCLNAGKVSIPETCSKSESKSVPGWTEYVATTRSRSIFWHNIWLDCGRPRCGVVADTMRRTRAAYHYSIRFVRKNEAAIVKQRFAESVLSSRSRDFWTEVKRMKHSSKSVSSIVDGCAERSEIAHVFADKYVDLYSCVGFDDRQMTLLKKEINERVAVLSVSDDFKICADEVRSAVKDLKCNKRDGYSGLSSDYVISACDELFIHIACLFSSLVVHGAVTDDMSFSTLLPIPKGKNANGSVSSNYRAIALSSVFGKIFDRIVMIRYEEALATSELQFGFKKNHSTAMCSLVLRETVEYYNHNQGTVFCTMLDATKAFDRIQYCKLFRKLLDRKLPVIVVRFLLNLYTSQQAHVLWNGHFSQWFDIKNGVKQGGVLSPVLFCVYLDGLLCALKSDGYGCFVGHVFTGAIAYADDLVLLAPSQNAMRNMLRVCEAYAGDYDMLFNASKSKCVVCSPKSSTQSCRLHTSPQFYISGNCIDVVDSWPHLGHIICKNSDDNLDILNRRSSFIAQANDVICTFGKLDCVTKMRLFNSYCGSFYGCELWDLSCDGLQAMCTTWRNALRRIFNLPRNCHTDIINVLCNNTPLFDSFCKRSIKFLRSCITSSNFVVNFIARHGVSYSRMFSRLGRNVQFCSERYGRKVGDIMNANVSLSFIDLDSSSRINPEMHDRAKLVWEMIMVKDDLKCMTDLQFSREDVAMFIEWCCTY